MESNYLSNINLLQSAATALFAVLVYITGQTLNELFILPIKKQKEVIGRIAYSLTFYGNRFPFQDNDGKLLNLDELKEASDSIRKLASNLRSSKYTIPLYTVLSRLKFVLEEKNLEECSLNLIGWSNSFFNKEHGDRTFFRKKIAESLKIKLL